MNPILKVAYSLIELTKNKILRWEYVIDAPCLTSVYGDTAYIICKTEIESGLPTVSLNYLNRNEELIGEFNKWDKGEDGYDIVDSLYSLALECPLSKIPAIRMNPLYIKNDLLLDTYKKEAEQQGLTSEQIEYVCRVASNGDYKHMVGTLLYMTSPL